MWSLLAGTTDPGNLVSHNIIDYAESKYIELFVCYFLRPCHPVQLCTMPTQGLENAVSEQVASLCSVA